MTKTKSPKTLSVTIEEKLRALNDLQIVDSQVDRIRIIRGELPLEIEDLNLLIDGLNDRLEKLNQDFTSVEEEKLARKNTIKDAKAAIKKYQKQLDNIKNNREFTSLTKEIEFQNLEIELSEKRIKESEAVLLTKKEVIDELAKQIKERKKELKLKNSELDEIVKETEKEEKSFLRKSTKAQKTIEERLLEAYNRIRGKVKNGLAVVSVDRDACGGCFNKIPSQRQLEIRLHKKIISCEHCGRILVDSSILGKK